MMNRRQNTTLVRQRQVAAQNQENAAVFAGKSALPGKAPLGAKNVSGVQTRARAALGDRSNTIHSEVQQATNKPLGKVQPMAKKTLKEAEPQPQQAKAGAGIVSRVRHIAKAAVSNRPRTRQGAEPSLTSKILGMSEQEAMEIDETNRSMRMDIEGMETPNKVAKLADTHNTPTVPTSERKHPSFSGKRNELREALVERYGGGITVPGNSTAHRVTNPDLGCENNTQMVTNYVYAIFDYLQDIEIERMPLAAGFLDHCTEITSRMRYVLVDWMIQIHSRFEMLPETFYLAVGLMDRYLSTPAGIEITKENLQLLGVTAMMVAAKFEEIYPPEVPDFVFVTGNSFSSAQIRDFEWRLLHGTGFFCSLPTPIAFLRRFSRLIQATSDMHCAAKYFCELTTTEYSLCHLTGCIRAAASVCLSHALIRHGNPSAKWDPVAVTEEKLRSLIADAWMPNLQFVTGFTVDDLFPVIRHIAAVVERQASPSKYRAIHNKYAAKDIYQIAMRSDLRSPLLSMLALSPEEDES